MRGSTITTIVLAVIGGAVLADILIHPSGTTAAGNAAAGLLVPSYAAVLGAVPAGYRNPGGGGMG